MARDDKNAYGQNVLVVCTWPQVSALGNKGKDQRKTEWTGIPEASPCWGETARALICLCACPTER